MIDPFRCTLFVFKKSFVNYFMVVVNVVFRERTYILENNMRESRSARLSWETLYPRDIVDWINQILMRKHISTIGSFYFCLSQNVYRNVFEQYQTQFFDARLIDRTKSRQELFTSQTGFFIIVERLAIQRTKFVQLLKSRKISATIKSSSPVICFHQRLRKWFIFTTFHSRFFFFFLNFDMTF